MFLTESSKSPAEVAKSNKQWVGTYLYQEGYKPLLINCGRILHYFCDELFGQSSEIQNLPAYS